MFSSFASLLPSTGIFAVLCWPFLVAWLLWISRRTGHVHSLAIAGAVMTIGAVCLFPSRLDMLGKVSVGLAGFLPMMLFCFADIQKDSETHESGEESVAAQVRGERLPFLITGCILMALSLFSALLSSLFIGAGCVILAWWDGLSPRRAMAAWAMVRVRLCGVILAVLGAALLQTVDTPPLAQGVKTQWGVVFLVTGLGMMAGLGSVTGQKPSFALLDGGLRFAALCLMARLGHYPLAHFVLLGAGLIGLVFSGFIKQRNEAFLPFLAALATMAASTQSLMAFLLLMAAALGGLGLRIWQKDKSADISYSVIPLIFVALLLIGQQLSPLYVGALILLAGFNLRSLQQVFSPDISLNMGKYSALKLCLVPGVMIVISLTALTFSGQSFPIGWYP